MGSYSCPLLSLYCLEISHLFLMGSKSSPLPAQLFIHLHKRQIWLVHSHLLPSLGHVAHVARQRLLWGIRVFDGASLFPSLLPLCPAPFTLGRLFRCTVKKNGNNSKIIMSLDGSYLLSILEKKKQRKWIKFFLIKTGLIL